MAIFGAQGLVTIIVMTFLQKIAKYYSLGRFALLDLVFYVHPTDEELKKAAGLSAGAQGKDRHKGSARLRNKAQHKDGNESPAAESFNIPRSTEVSLETGRMRPTDLAILRFFPEFEWLVNFGFGAFVVYAATEIYLGVAQPKAEFNLSMIWLLLTIMFCLQNLFSMVKLYFQTDDDGERAIVIVFGFSFFLMALVVLIIDESLLELGLEPAYRDFAANAKQFLESQGMEGSSHISKMTFKMVLALSAALFGALLAWPGIRLAKMHRAALRYEGERPAGKLLTHLNLFFPLLIASTWVKPAFRDVLVNRRFFKGKNFLSDATFDTLRLYAILVFCLLRLLLVRRYLQGYLNSAYERSQSLKKEAGKILNSDYQKMIARVYYYMVVVALQYVVPVIMLLCFTGLFKTQGNLNWGLQLRPANATTIAAANSTAPESAPSIANNQTFDEFDSIPVSPSPASPTAAPTADSPSSAADQTSSSSSSSSSPGADPTGRDAVSERVTQLTSVVLSVAPVFGPVFMRGVCAFAVWWTAFVMVVTSGFGVLYYEYFAISMTGI